MFDFSSSAMWNCEPCPYIFTTKTWQQHFHRLHLKFKFLPTKTLTEPTAAYLIFVVIAIQTEAVANYKEPLIAVSKCKGTVYALQQWASLMNIALEDLWII